MSRLKPCCEKGSVEKNKFIAENSTQNAVNDNLPALNNEKPTENDNHYCLWCDSTFSTKFNLKVHNDRCKMVNDPVKVLEREVGVLTPTVYRNKFCKFCDRSFSRKFSADSHRNVCKKRENYLNALKNEKNNKINNKLHYLLDNYKANESNITNSELLLD
jgi:hypothetical protein